MRDCCLRVLVGAALSVGLLRCSQSELDKVKLVPVRESSPSRIARHHGTMSFRPLAAKGNQSPYQPAAEIDRRHFRLKTVTRDGARPVVQGDPLLRPSRPERFLRPAQIP